MKTTVARLIAKVTYLNVILTVIAVTLILQFAHSLGLFEVRKAHARDIMAVHIQSVEGNIPVAIKAPVAYGGSVCANPCK